MNAVTRRPGDALTIVSSLVPHIGHLHSMVVADIFARHARLQRPDREVHFMTGTDEHGLKIQKAAKEAGLKFQAFCDSLSLHFRVSAIVATSTAVANCS